MLLAEEVDTQKAPSWVCLSKGEEKVVSPISKTNKYKDFPKGSHFLETLANLAIWSLALFCCFWGVIEELIDFCKETLAGFKVPKKIDFRELPKTSTGKIQKFELRKIAKELN